MPALSPTRITTPPSGTVSAAGKGTALHRELVALFDGALHPVVALRNGRVVHANPAFQELLGQERTLRGKALADLCNPQDRGLLEGLGRTENAPAEVMLRLVGPPALNVEATVVTLTLGGRSMVILRLRRLPATRQHVREPPSGALLADRPLWDLLERATTGFWLGDVDGRTILCNQHSATLLGMRLEDLYAVTLFDLLKLEGGPALEGVQHVAYVRPDGAEVQLEVGLATFLTEDGRPAGAFALLRDMTAQSQMLKELRRSERRFRALVETAPCAVCVMGAGGGPFYEVNAAATQIFGYRRDEWLSGGVTPVQLYADPEDRPRLLDKVRAEGRVTDVPLLMRRRNGDTFPARMSVTRFFSEGDERLAVAALDCSGETARASHRTGDVARVLAALEQAVQEPLVDLHAQLLTPAAPLDPAAARARLEAASRRAHRLLADMALFAQVDAAVPGSEKVELHRVWKELTLEESAWLQGATVTEEEAPGPCAVRGTPALLRLLLRSLMHHGVRQGPGASVHFFLRQLDGDAAVFCVEDNAPPPPEEIRARVFELFEWPAAGPLGLALAATVVERQGGRIWMEYPAPGGVRVCFSLPRFVDGKR